jgi:hypothetical protein
MSDHVIDPFTAGHLGELTQSVPFDLVDAVLAEAGGVQQRVRRLPSRVVVYLLLAGVLFRDLGWQLVWSKLTGTLTGAGRPPAKSSIWQAMGRVTPGPLKALFDVLKGPGATTCTRAVVFAGRLVVAVDGTSMQVADTGPNARVYRKPAGKKSAGYARLRLVALVACGTRTIMDAVFGPDSIGEQRLVPHLVGALRPGMVLLADRNFCFKAFMASIAAQGADFVLRAKSGRGALKLPVMRELGDGTYLSKAGHLGVRVIDAAITTINEQGQRTTHAYRLVTTIMDADPVDLVKVYHERWEIETTFAEMKTTILGGYVLRAKHPTGVEQEVWATLACYQVLRTHTADVMLTRPTTDPDRASFTVALNAARDQTIRATGIHPATPIDLLGYIGTQILTHLLPPRRARTRVRVKKNPLTRYTAKAGTDRQTHTLTSININLTTPTNP